MPHFGQILGDHWGTDRQSYWSWEPWNHVVHVRDHWGALSILSKFFFNSLLRHHGFYFVLGWKRWTSCWFWWEYCWDEPLYEEAKNLIRTSKANCWMYGQAWVLVCHLCFNRTDESNKHIMCSEIYASVRFQPNLARLKKLAAHLIWLVFGIAFFLAHLALWAPMLFSVKLNRLDVSIGDIHILWCSNPGHLSTDLPYTIWRFIKRLRCSLFDESTPTPLSSSCRLAEGVRKLRQKLASQLYRSSRWVSFRG
jgi:hypothetical protein